MSNGRKFIAHKICALLLLVALLFAGFTFRVGNSFAADGDVSLVTTLRDEFEQKGARRTFDVFAKDENGDKINPADIQCTLNGKEVAVNWDDSTKTSYTLNFSTLESGTYPIVIKILDGENVLLERTFTVHYAKAAPGDLIGELTIDVEASTINRGFIVEPLKVPVLEGENAAQILMQMLHDHGFGVDYTGSPEKGFYMSRIVGTGGDKGQDGFTPTESLKLENLGYEESIEEYVSNNFGEFDADSGSVESLGEFDYTFGSGWMYCLNNIFPNVGFADSWPADGDVIRVQFTLAYGSDIGGGMPGMEDLGRAIANKDALVTAMADINMDEELKENSAVQDDYREASALIHNLLAPQESVDTQTKKLYQAIADAFAEDVMAAPAPEDLTEDDIALVEALNKKYKSLSKQAQSLVSQDAQNKLALMNTLIGTEPVLTADEDKNADSNVLIKDGTLIYTKGESTKAVFTVENRNPKHLSAVKVDDQALSKSDYDTADGSIILTLKKSYLDTLETGKHKLLVETKLGKGETTFEVKGTLKEYKAAYAFKSITAGMQLPENIAKGLLPETKEHLADKTKVEPVFPAKDTIAVKGGKWIFKGYEPKDATIDGADVKFVGSWEFVKDEPKPNQPGKTDLNKPGKDKGPETGDSSHAAGYAIVVLITAGAAYFMARKKKSRDGQDDC